MLKYSHLSLNAQHFLLMFRRSAAHRKHDLVPRVEPDVVEEGDGEEKHHKDEPIVHNYVLWKRKQTMIIVECCGF